MWRLHWHKGGKVQTRVHWTVHQQSSCSLSFGGYVVRPSAGAQTCPTLHLVLYSRNNWLLNWPTKGSTLSCISVWTPELTLTTVYRRSQSMIHAREDQHINSRTKISNTSSLKSQVAMTSSIVVAPKKARWRWRTNFDVRLDNLKVGLSSSTKVLLDRRAWPLH